jgi:23S rRNA (guanosine2251-2'-O)-methyltransferase
MEKIVGMNAVKEVLKSDKNVEKLEIYKGVKKIQLKKF